MKPSYFAKLLKRYLHDECTTGEAWTVDQWYEARDMPRPPALTPAEQAADKARNWQQLHARIQAAPRPLQWPAPALRWAAAATMVLGVGMATLWPKDSRRPLADRAAAHGRAVEIRESRGWLTCTNASARPTSLALADGSTLTLAPGSRLRYPKRFGGPERLVRLEGEAFFQVFHDEKHPFRVLTTQLETLVLGTSFTVRAYPDQPNATVLVRTGRVQVRPVVSNATVSGTNSAGLVLLPNQQAVYAPARQEMRRMLADQPALLQPQTLAFAERPVAEVLTSLQAGYGVPIRYNGAALAACTVSLAFTTETLYEKLDLLCKILDASYERTDQAIIFRSRGCQSN